MAKRPGKDATKGVQPIIEEAGRVTLGGEEYPVRRFCVKDTFRLARIIANAAGTATLALGRMPTNLRQISVEQAVALVISALAHGEKDVLEFLGSLVGLSAEEFAALPMGSEIVLLKHLEQSQDLKAFWDAFLGMAEANPAIQRALQEPSTSSNPGTEGSQTSKS